MQAVTAVREEPTMSKFKIEHGASKVNLVLLKTSIEDTISQDLDLLATWSDNDQKYLVNELLRFALTQEEDFQKYKASLAANKIQPVSNSKTAPTQTKSATEPALRPESPVNSTTARI
jgi:hypothetical protein